MENGLKNFLTKHYGSWENAVVKDDNGKTVLVKIDFGDDEILNVVINRRNGGNGNYRIVSES